MIRRFVLGTIGTAIAFAVVAAVVPQISYGGSITGLIVLAVVFGVVNGLIGPVVRILSLPITLVTFGLFALVINGGLLLLTAALAGRAGVPFTIADFPPRLSLDAIVIAIFAALVLSIASFVIDRVLPD